MDLFEALYYKLSNTTAITEYTSNRIYPEIASQHANLPYITMHLISNVRGEFHTMINDPLLYSPYVQLSLWSSGYPQARSMANSLRNTLKDFTGVMGGTGGITVQRCFWEDENEFSEIEEQTNAPIFHIAQDYIIWHTTST